MNPVAARAGYKKRSGQSAFIQSPKSYNSPTFCDTLNLLAGRARSFNPAATNAHFIRGAQKKTVLGPAVLSVKIIPTGLIQSHTSRVIHKGCKF
jgi:hypothetical protein